MKNIDKFLIELKDLNLPIEDYLIVSSGPLAIRGIRDCGDLDILVSDKLFHELSDTYPVIIGESISKVSLGNIEFLHRNEKQNDEYDFDRQRAHVEIINDVPFQDLKTCLYFKEKGEREKDKKDTELIKEYLSKSYE